MRHSTFSRSSLSENFKEYMWTFFSALRNQYIFGQNEKSIRWIGLLNITRDSSDKDSMARGYPKATAHILNHIQCLPKSQAPFSLPCLEYKHTSRINFKSRDHSGSNGGPCRGNGTKLGCTMTICLSLVSNTRLGEWMRLPTMIFHQR